MAKISVIIPCYNVEKWIDRCLESIVEQTIGLENIEIICVDDCSTDKTLEKLFEWEKKYPDNFIIIRSPANGRQGQARNIGLEYAKARWIAFIDSDDWVDREYLEILYSLANKGDYEIVSCKNIRDSSTSLQYTLHDNEEVRIREFNIETNEDRKPLLLNPELDYNAWGKLIRKDFLVDNDLLFMTNITYEDAAWGSLVHLYVKRAIMTDMCLYHYFVNQDSTVLSTNSNHHIDCLTVQTYLWREYEKRGFLDVYRSELEVEHLYSAYLAGFKMCILRFEKPDYNIYLLLRELVIDRIPDYMKNEYVQKGLISELHMNILMSLKIKLNREQFMELAQQAKTIGI